MRTVVGKLRRALFALPYVARHEDGVPLAELAALFGLTPAQMAKEIAELSEVGAPGADPGAFFNIGIDGRGAAARVTATPSALLRAPPRLSPHEAHGLLLGAAALRRTGLPVFDRALARATDKIVKLLRGPGRPAGAAAVAEPVAIDAGGRVRDEVFGPLARAARERRVVELDYASVSSQRRRKLTVEPYGLLNHTGGWYLLGKSLTHADGQVRVFKLERMRAVAVLDRRYEPPADFDLRRYPGDKMFITSLAPVRVKLRLRGQAARRLGRQYRRARLERTGAGSALIVQFRDYPNGWLAAWVLRQGPEVEVLAPPALAAWVAELARRVAAAHAGVGVSAETPATQRHSQRL